MAFAWMAWTPQTAIFFCFIALSLVILTLLAIYRPETPRKGILGFPTTRGDRFFVSLLGMISSGKALRSPLLPPIQRTSLGLGLATGLRTISVCQ